MLSIVFNIRLKGVFVFLKFCEQLTTVCSLTCAMMATIHDLPNEVLLVIFSHLPLRSNWLPRLSYVFPQAVVNERWCSLSFEVYWAMKGREWHGNTNRTSVFRTWKASACLDAKSDTIKVYGGQTFSAITKLYATFEV